MKNRYLLLTTVFFLFLASCQAKMEKKNMGQELTEDCQVDSIDLDILNSLNQIAKNLQYDSLTTEDQIIEIGKLFLQTPYVGGTLENNVNEELVINLHQLDCTTYLENVLALSQTLKQSQVSTSNFSKNIELIRYRNGQLNDYTSRLHYFTDWIINNEKKRLVKNITQEIGGEPYFKTINFMSSHVSSYPALVKDSSLIEKIKETEKRLNSQQHFYIPENKIQQVEDKIHNGDFIAITTRIKGLDVSHTGIAIHINERLHLMHASSNAKKVVISELPLAEKIQKNSLQTGIIVVRVISKQ
ncbi:N-acetylmuramoyl-L-alanine amidase-like domain-containing protein [Ancylomarina sp. 16SWW S1-10-2]|uniref:N-acetylmuramoyl-L-alanine amidase-like domain-containing protein n=1 Tax=Ancylomarina sp. 16SWW S1-10-2 TaxID=2499681 RepID=UPI0012ADFF48|nr:N-acetylmuramoyl-L-alanine amidase-like domain-containing protein [Ancylomarina sp. 16SWW S1-10-2]MRT94055.1 DUF1460 domain-containing protein [Ancylomarina sp. 16SWW S1-10-2]